MDSGRAEGPFARRSVQRGEKIHALQSPWGLKKCRCCVYNEPIGQDSF